MTNEQIEQLIKTALATKAGPLDEVQAQAAAVQLIDAVQTDAAIAKKIQDRNEAANEWITPNIAAVDPLAALAAREQVHTTFDAAIQQDREQWARYTGMITGAILPIATAVMTGNPVPAITAALPIITEALMALSGGGD